MFSFRRGRNWRATAVAAVAISLVGVTSVVATGPLANVAGASGKSITIVLGAEPATLDPIVGSRQGGEIWDAILQPLIQYNVKTLTPDGDGLVTSWTRVNALTWDFNLRPNIMFTDGEAANAAAAAQSILDNQSSANPAAILGGYFAPVTGATALSATEFQVTTSTPLGDLPDLLTTTYMLPPTYYKTEGSAGFSAHPIGTGPYMFSSSVPGVSISLVPNPNYWGTPAPLLSGIKFIWESNPTSAIALVQSGQAQIAFDVPPSSASGLTGFKVTSTPVARSNDLFAVTQYAPMNNAKFRTAMAEAIDRDAIVKGIFKGQAIAQKSLLTVNPTVQNIAAVPYNPTAAKKLLAKCNCNKPIDLTYPTGLLPDMDLVAQAIASQLDAVGFKVTLKPVTYGAQITGIITKTVRGIYLTAVVPNAPTPAFLSQGFLTSTSITQNCTYDSRFDTEQADALATNSAASAQAIYNLMDTQAVDQDHCYVPIYSTDLVSVMSKAVTGYLVSPLNMVIFANLNLK